MYKKNIRAILDRFNEYYGAKTDAELAEKLGITPGAVSAWIARNSLPKWVLYKYELEINKSISSEDSAEYETEEDITANLHDLIEELGAAEKRLIFETTQELLQFKKWRADFERKFEDLLQRIEKIEKGSGRDVGRD